MKTSEYYDKVADIYDGLYKDEIEKLFKKPTKGMTKKTIKFINHINY